MIASILAQGSDWIRPDVDWHALAPELVLIVGINLVLLIDLWLDEAKKWMMGALTGFVLLGAFIPVVTLAVVGDTPVRSMFFDRYVVDEYALILKALFLLVGYVIVLMSQTELEEHGYYQGEFYVLLLASVLGMVMMASSRDLVSVFVALELLSIPAYMMAAWKKRDPKSNEAGVKYYLLGVFASGVLLYGMSYLYGTTGSTKLTEIGASLGENPINAMQVIAVVFVIVGFGFKVSAVPFHTWAPDTYEGAPLPVTAFLSVASKAAGFVGLVTMLFLAMYGADGVYEPFIWVLAALTMTVGNVLALRQTNIVRLLAYSSVSQGGFILMPLAVIATGDAGESALKSVVIYLLIYALSNLGAFAVVMAVSRKTGSARDLLVRWTDELLAGARHDADALPGVAHRDPTVRPLDRQAAGVQDAARRRWHPGLHPGGHRCGQHRDLGGVLHEGASRDVDEAGSGRRRHTHRDSPADLVGARYLLDRHGRARHPARPRPAIRRSRGLDRRLRRLSRRSPRPGGLAASVTFADAETFRPDRSDGMARAASTRRTRRPRTVTCEPVPSPCAAGHRLSGQDRPTRRR